MPDTAPVHTVGVTDTPDAAERAVRAAMRISARCGCALTRTAAEQIADAILGCADTDVFTDYSLPDDTYGSMRPGALDGLRESMRNHLAITALKDGLLLTALPHEITDRPPGPEGRFLRRIRLIAPARIAPGRAGEGGQTAEVPVER